MTAEPLCSHGNRASACDVMSHTVARWCPRHLVGWSVLRESGCWHTDDDGQPCTATPELGDTPKPVGEAEDAVVIVSREQQMEASWVLTEALEGST